MQKEDAMVFEFCFEKLGPDFMLVSVNTNTHIETRDNQDGLFEKMKERLGNQIPKCLEGSFDEADKCIALITDMQRRKGCPIVRAIVAYAGSEELMQQLKEASFKESVPG